MIQPTVYTTSRIRKHALVEMLPALRIRPPLLDRLAHLALRAHDDDRDRAMTEAVLGHAAHAWRTECGAPRLHHPASPPRADDDAVWAVQCDEPVDRLCRLAGDELDNDGELRKKIDGQEGQDANGTADGPCGCDRDQHTCLVSCA